MILFHFLIVNENELLLLLEFFDYEKYETFYFNFWHLDYYYIEFLLYTI